MAVNIIYEHADEKLQCVLLPRGKTEGVYSSNACKHVCISHTVLLCLHKKIPSARAAPVTGTDTLKPYGFSCRAFRLLSCLGGTLSHSTTSRVSSLKQHKSASRAQYVPFVGARSFSVYAGLLIINGPAQHTSMPIASSVEAFY